MTAEQISIDATGYVVVTEVNGALCLASRGPAQSVQIFDRRRDALDYRDYMRAVAGHPESRVVKVQYTVATENR